LHEIFVIKVLKAFKFQKFYNKPYTLRSNWLSEYENSHSLNELYPRYSRLVIKRSNYSEN